MGLGSLLARNEAMDDEKAHALVVKNRQRQFSPKSSDDEEYDNDISLSNVEFLSTLSPSSHAGIPFDQTTHLSGSHLKPDEITSHDVELKKGMQVYCSGPHRNADTKKVRENHKVVLNIFTGKYDNHTEIRFQRWDAFTFIKREKHSSEPKDLIFLQRLIYPHELIRLTWSEFMEKFTPFSKEKSEKSQSHKGSAFRSGDWIIDGANLSNHSHGKRRQY